MKKIVTLEFKNQIVRLIGGLTIKMEQESKVQLPYEWHKAAMDAAFVPQDGTGALVYNNKMWLIGG